ncbi:hypothetical protein [Actinoplanes sp. NPDC048796]|uniref:hypothetical protein n=1 Tax=Actinoplanes sp. NPDC048796 TaxID=3155640 RepID=UPI0033C9F940
MAACAGGRGNGIAACAGDCGAFEGVVEGCAEDGGVEGGEVEGAVDGGGEVGVATAGGAEGEAVSGCVVSTVAGEPGVRGSG